MSQVSHGAEFDSGTNRTELKVVPTPETTNPPDIDFHFASHADTSKLAEYFEAMAANHALASLKHQLDHIYNRSAAGPIILTFAAEFTGLIPRDDNEHETERNTSFKIQVNEAERCYRDEFFDQQGTSLDIDKLEALFDSTSDYNNQTLIQIVHFVKNRIPSAPDEYFQDAERIIRILIAKDLSN